MIVIMLSDCPPKVRGDLSKWLCEINTGVFVGNVSSRVREEVWQRICENIKSGQATMVFSAPGEQKMDFRVHNTTWEPVELDGIKLMRRAVRIHNLLLQHTGKDILLLVLSLSLCRHLCYRMCFRAFL